MKKSDRKFLILLSVIIFLACAASICLFYFAIKPKDHPAENDPLAYDQMLSPEDTNPLDIPSESMQNKRTIKVPILMYHHIGDLPEKPNSTRKDLTVSAQDFEAQVKWLKEQEYVSVSLDWLYTKSSNKNFNIQKPVIFTFDDGYEDVFDYAVPILRKYGFTGSFAIITGFAGQAQGDNIYASWDRIRKAYSQGMEIACHTQNHFDGKNKKYSGDYIYNNLLGCRQDIKNNLGFDVNVLIYPYGHYTKNYIEQAKKAGFLVGVTIHQGSLINLDDLMQVPRLRIHRDEDFEKFKNTLGK